jgi:acetyl esterase/lipase
MKAMGLCLLVVTAGPSVAAQSPRGYRSDAVDTAHGEREFVLLWPEGAPGAVGTEPQDKPKLTLYRAPAASANGTGIVVCPGGGYRTLASDHEGKQVAEWLNSLGVSAFVLQYRVGPRYRHPAPLQDAQRALRLVRSRAAEYRIDPRRLGILGFSAGGHLASTTGTQPDDPVDGVSARPDFMILAYPVISMTAPFLHRGSLAFLLGETPDPKLAEQLSSEKQVSARTPPTFLFHTADDPGVSVANSLAFFAAMRAEGVPAELHAFEKGRHGVGLAQGDAALSAWPKLLETWLRARGLLSPR